jgi:hypothetical protein
MGPAKLRCQLLRDAAVRHKMGPVSGAHPVLARLTHGAPPWTPEPGMCHLYFAEGGVISILRLHAVTKKESQMMDSGKFALLQSEERQGVRVGVAQSLGRLWARCLIQFSRFSPTMIGL